MNRREFLRGMMAAGGGAATFAALPPAARRAIAEARGAPAGMIVRNDWPEHWETSVEALGRSRLTANDRFFVRSHFPVPEIDPGAWRVEVAGARNPLTLNLAGLRKLPAHEEECVLECAGNGRAGYHLPSTSGTQWGLGAVGNARWSGTRLADVLAAAGVPPEVKHVWFECADRAPLDTTPRFLRSIPIEKAMKDALLVWTMNGAPLPTLHGGPLRVIVPGWFGMASAKWVTRIRLEAAPSDNHFMVRGYRYNYPGVDPAATEPVEGVRIKSLITSPLDGATVPAGKLVVRGFAWAGAEGVSSVMVREIGGPRGLPETWDAPLDATTTRFAWRAWEAAVTVETGSEMDLSAIAVDSADQSQPQPLAKANGGGYGNNSAHRIRVHVRA